MSTSTILNNDIMAKLFRALHNPTKFQDWWFLLNPNDETYLSNNNKIISINELFDISISDQNLFLSHSSIIQKRGNNNQFRLDLNKLDQFKIENNLNYVYSKYQKKTFISFNDKIVSLPKEVLNKDNNISFNKDKMITSFSSDTVEIINDMKAYINNISVGSDSTITNSPCSNKNNEEEFDFQKEYPFVGVGIKKFGTETSEGIHC